MKLKLFKHDRVIKIHHVFAYHVSLETQFELYQVFFCHWVIKWFINFFHV